MAEDSTPPQSERARRRADVPVLLDRIAGWSWRLLVIGFAVLAASVLLSRLRLVVLPMGLALLLAAALEPPARWMRQRGMRPLFAAWLTFLGFIGVVAGLGVAIVPGLVDQFGDLGPTLEDAADDVEAWFVDGPLALDPGQVADFRDDLDTSLRDAISTDGALLDSAVIAGEIVAGTVLTLVIAFFLVKDGEKLQRWAVARLRVEHRETARRMGAAAFSTLGRYLGGAATLGAIEAAIMGVALALTGSSVILPVVALTFLAAFVPFVGAIVAGVIAVLVSLVSSGVGAAVVVAVVAIVVQQFDNELLAPWIYGRALQLHPLVVILAVATGAALGGFLGAFLAVPVAAVAVNSLVAGMAANAAAELDGASDGSVRTDAS